MSGHFPPASDLDRPGHATLKGWLFDEVLTSFSRSSWDIVPWTPMTASPHTCDGQGAHHWTWFFFRGLNRQICVATRCLCKSSAAHRCRKLEASKSNDRRRHWGSRRQPPIQGPGTCRRVSGGGRRCHHTFAHSELPPPRQRHLARPSEEGHDLFAIAYRPLRVPLWPRNTVKARLACQEACPISHLCVCPGKHLSHAMCHGTLCVRRRMPSSQPDRGPASTLFRRENAAMLSVMGLS